MGRLNRPAQAGYTYRSPSQTNARDLSPSLREDVVASQRADVGRIQRGLSADAAREYNRRQQQEAGGRAIMRTAGRAGLAGTALQAGMELGRAIDEKTGVGRKIVDRVMGPAKAEGDRVELSAESKRRIARGDLDAPEAKDSEAETPEAKAGKTKVKATKAVPYSKSDTRETVEDDEMRTSDLKRGGKIKKYAKGGAVSASSRADGIAQRGKTKCKVM